MRKSLLGSLVITLAVGLPAGAPSAQNVLMEEIITTAQRREQLAQDVPLAVTAYSAEQLERLQVTETLDITRLVPNLIGHNNTGLGTANTYSLRGLNNTESIATFDPPVGSYVDDIYVTRQNANNFTLFDVDRIEVLRGPQGTLFGRNTTGGAVRVILKKPAEELGGYAELGYGEFDRIQVRGSVDIPISDRVLTKISGYYIEDDGFVTSRTTGEDDINFEENYGIRGHALFKITDNLSWDIALDFINTDHANLLNERVGDDRFTDTGLSQKGSPLRGILTGNKQNFGLGNEVESFNISSVVDIAVGDLGTLSLITGWRDLDQDFALDFFNGTAPYGGFTIANEGNHEQFTQEIKWDSTLGDRITYVAGFYFIDEDNSTDFGDIFDLGFPLVLADRVLDNSTEAWAIYAQADYAVNDRWTLTVGARYTDEEKEVSFRDNRASCMPVTPSCLDTANLIANGIPTKQDEQIVTPRFAVKYDASEDLSFYASATRGFKSGGWNARGTAPENLQPFGPEKVWSYEGGAKSEWLDKRLRINLTAFLSDIEDFQLPSAFRTPSGGIIFITRNFADLEVKGLEAEITYSPVDPLTLFLTVGLQDGEYKNLSREILEQQQRCLVNGVNCEQGIVNPDGEIADPVRTPDYTLTAGFNHVWQLGANLELIPSAYLYAVGDHSVGTSGGPESINDGYETWNGSLTLNHVEQNWSLVAECKNCNDKKMVVSTLAGFQYLQDPRTWMVRFKWNFGARER